jgi:hypothetical protein
VHEGLYWLVGRGIEGNVHAGVLTNDNGLGRPDWNRRQTGRRRPAPCLGSSAGWWCYGARMVVTLRRGVSACIAEPVGQVVACSGEQDYMRLWQSYRSQETMRVRCKTKQGDWERASVLTRTKDRWWMTVPNAASDQSRQGHGFCSMTFSLDVLLRNTTDLVGTTILTSFGSRRTWSHAGRIRGRIDRCGSELQMQK